MRRRTRWEEAFERTHLCAIGRALDDAVDELGGVALGEQTLGVEDYVPGDGDRRRVHVHFGRDGQGGGVFVVAACEVVGADVVQVLEHVGRYEVPVADPHGGHGDRGRVRTSPLDEIALSEFGGKNVTPFGRQ